MGTELSIGAIIFTGVILYGLYKLLLEPFIGGGHRSHGDRWHRR